MSILHSFLKPSSPVVSCQPIKPLNFTSHFAMAGFSLRQHQALLSSLLHNVHLSAKNVSGIVYSIKGRRNIQRSVKGQCLAIVFKLYSIRMRAYFNCTLSYFLTVIRRARMGYESIAHEAEGNKKLLAS